MQKELYPQTRWMIKRDMEEVLEIEEKSFDFPWEESDFISYLRSSIVVGKVAENNESVVGFLIYELHKYQVYILNIAVDPLLRRYGVGSCLIDGLIRKLTLRRRNRIVLNVRETNLSAQLFFRALGFRATAVLRNLYEETREDAYLMEYCYQPLVHFQNFWEHQAFF